MPARENIKPSDVLINKYDGYGIKITIVKRLLLRVWLVNNGQQIILVGSK